MLPEIAAEVLLFLSRRDLDKACAVSKWLDAMIAQCCDVFPLRSVAAVTLLHKRNTLAPKVSIKEDGDSVTHHSFSTMEEASSFTGSILRRSYVKRLQLGSVSASMTTIAQYHWSTLIEAIRSGAVRDLYFSCADLSALDEDAFMVIVDRRGLQSLVIRRSVVPSCFVPDALIRACGARGLLRLFIFENHNDAPLRFSDAAVLEFVFLADVAPGGRPRNLVLEGSGLTESLFAKFLERLRTSTARPSGSLQLLGGAAKQRGLSEYAQHVAPSGLSHPRYRFPSMVDDDNQSYEVALYEHSFVAHIWFGLVHRSS